MFNNESQGENPAFLQINQKGTMITATQISATIMIMGKINIIVCMICC